MHDVHIGDDAELYAMGALDSHDRARVDEHIAHCSVCLRAVGEAEETVLALERGWQPRTPPPSLERTMRFGATPRPGRMWMAIAAAFLIGLLPSVALLLRHPVPTARDRASVAMIESHFNHAQFAGPGGPPAKVIYARDRSWLYVLVANTNAYDVYAIERGVAHRLGTTVSTGTTSELFVDHPGALDAVQLRSGSAVIEEAKVR